MAEAARDAGDEPRLVLHDVFLSGLSATCNKKAPLRLFVFDTLMLKGNIAVINSDVEVIE